MKTSSLLTSNKLLNQFLPDCLTEPTHLIQTKECQNGIKNEENIQQNWFSKIKHYHIFVQNQLVSSYNWSFFCWGIQRFFRKRESWFCFFLLLDVCIAVKITSPTSFGLQSTDIIFVLRCYCIILVLYSFASSEKKKKKYVYVFFNQFE